jgi:hypothetical protein
VDEDAGGNAEEVGGRIDVNPRWAATGVAAIEALQKGDREAWASLFEPDAKLYDDGNPRSLQKFNQEALGNERFTSIEHVNNHRLYLTGKFHSKQWGDFRTYFRFQISSGGKITRLDIGQTE